MKLYEYDGGQLGLRQREGGGFVLVYYSLIRPTSDIAVYSSGTRRQDGATMVGIEFDLHFDRKAASNLGDEDRHPASTSYRPRSVDK